MNRLNLHIMADSASEISPENAKKYDIDIIPMIVMEGNREYLDGINFVADDLLAGLLENKQYKTAQIPLNIYLQKFKTYAEKKLSLVCFVLSSGLTGSYETALMAKNMVCEKYPEADITVIDSKSASQGYGIVVLESAKYLEQHANLMQELQLREGNLFTVYFITITQMLHQAEEPFL